MINASKVDRLLSKIYSSSSRYNGGELSWEDKKNEDHAAVQEWVQGLPQPPNVDTVARLQQERDQLQHELAMRKKGARPVREFLDEQASQPPTLLRQIAALAYDTSKAADDRIREIQALWEGAGSPPPEARFTPVCSYTDEGHPEVEMLQVPNGKWMRVPETKEADLGQHICVDGKYHINWKKNCSRCNAPTKPACQCGHPYIQHQTPGMECSDMRCTCNQYSAADENSDPFADAPLTEPGSRLEADLVKMTSPPVPPGHFLRGEINRHYCKNCGKHYDAHLHTDEASTCPVETQAVWTNEMVEANDRAADELLQKMKPARVADENSDRCIGLCRLESGGPRCGDCGYAVETTPSQAVSSIDFHQRTGKRKECDCCAGTGEHFFPFSSVASSCGHCSGTGWISEKKTVATLACGYDVGFNFRCRRARGHEGPHTWDPKRLLGEDPVSEELSP